jgi:hypothetical protein
MQFFSKNHSKAEIEQIEILELLCKKYNIPEFTKKVVVEEGAIPHSHPVLTLNTRTKDELSILQTLLHEQFHWYVKEHPKFDEWIQYVEGKYSDYGHIVVCFNTRNYLQKILTSEEVERVYNLWQPYPEIEKLVTDEFDQIAKDLQKFNLVY